MIVTVINQKGGVGKTTTAVNLAYILSRNKNVGLIDMDPEGGTTTSFGLKREKKEIPLGGKSVNIFNVELFPSHLGLLKMELNGDVEEVTNSLKNIAKSFDLLVIDTPPNLGTLALASMIAADKILSPVTPQPLAMEAAKNLDSRLQSLEKKAMAFTNMSAKPIEINLQSVNFLKISVPQSKIFIEASRLGVPASRYEEIRMKKPKLIRFYEELSKAILE
ncbi:MULTISPECIES: ParA family protein [Acidianus]|uniref:Plasmid partitioning protein ParA n=1 Tax=Candidatus Acidianus copahuensis TaxID=1160895 RepID=A0A031LPS3_9CREN|nr:MULTISPECIES: ParA family protein [Acidianus]EZQ04798.1 plasmid partitioning protein ParA [Candidatus Acidianus copahuensis]NON63457.1 ParA family protein [Acidianus sp. RZ1]